MTKILAVVIAIVVFVVVLVGVYNTMLVNEEAKLRANASELYGKYGDQVAYKSLELCRQYFSDEIRGKFLGRLETIAKMGMWGENYNHIISDMMRELEMRATQKIDWSLYRELDKFVALNILTPRLQILEMEDELNNLLQLRCKDDPSWSNVPLNLLQLRRKDGPSWSNVPLCQRMEEIQKKLDQMLAQ